MSKGFDPDVHLVKVRERERERDSVCVRELGIVCEIGCVRVCVS